MLRPPIHSLCYLGILKVPQWTGYSVVRSQQRKAAGRLEPAGPEVSWRRAQLKTPHRKRGWPSKRKEGERAHLNTHLSPDMSFNSFRSTLELVLLSPIFGVGNQSSGNKKHYQGQEAGKGKHWDLNPNGANSKTNVLPTSQACVLGDTDQNDTNGPR